MGSDYDAGITSHLRDSIAGHFIAGGSLYIPGRAEQGRKDKRSLFEGGSIRKIKLWKQKAAIYDDGFCLSYIRRYQDE